MRTEEVFSVMVPYAEKLKQLDEALVLANEAKTIISNAEA